MSKKKKKNREKQESEVNKEMPLDFVQGITEEVDSMPDSDSSALDNFVKEDGFEENEYKFVCEDDSEDDSDFKEDDDVFFIGDEDDSDFEDDDEFGDIEEDDDDFFVDDEEEFEDDDAFCNFGSDDEFDCSDEDDKDAYNVPEDFWDDYDVDESSDNSNDEEEFPDNLDDAFSFNDEDSNYDPLDPDAFDKAVDNLKQRGFKGLLEKEPMSPSLLDDIIKKCSFKNNEFNITIKGDLHIHF